MTRFIALIQLVVMVAVAAAGFTWWTLEVSGVGVLRTLGPNGSLRDTHVWFAEEGETTWVEAANGHRPFLRDLRNDARAWLQRDRFVSEMTASISDAPSDRAHVRKLLRDKYGFRDVWVALFADTSHSYVVKLVPGKH
jgi:hypothetical protein